MIIKNGIVADPASGLYEHMDILVKDGKIVKIDLTSHVRQTLLQLKKKK